VVVSGAAGAIGDAVERRLAAAGARPLRLDAAAEDPGTLDAFAQRAARECGSLALVNVFAPERRRPFLETPWREFEGAYRAAMLAAFELSRALALQMTRMRGGDIVNVVPVAAVEATDGAAEIAAVGGGLAALTRALARELRPRRIRVNLVVARTAADDLGLELTPERAGYGARPAPVSAEDVAEAVAYLLDARSAAVIGGVVHVTGAEPTAR
jgi:3-oxoacyl-[acyl-carrier protein] reductase